MMVSTRGRYALRVMADMAENMSRGYVAMKEIAARQEISLKYLEKILPDLVEAGFVEGMHGRNGGYRLTRKPEDYTVGEILRAAEGDLAPVACLCDDAPECERSQNCRTRPLWEGLNAAIGAYLDGIKLSELVK
ncbi:MAG: RrF2 family transcriptional regulator [Clostridia bacterium]|nr:RrF2 family transcriptional regulator [Clostridia bacterium]MCR4578632.1 RrF2 family transcriptional regulator [Clostridiales bacterium]